MINDPIADLLSQLKNAQRAKKEKICVPHSKMKVAILSILKKEGVIDDLTERQSRGRKILEIHLPMIERQNIFPNFARVSKPGRRIYVRSKDIPRSLKGYGLVVLSTPQGVMTGREARRKGLGGEILFKEI
jgi:small subunit ribosomal protein S8